MDKCIHQKILFLYAFISGILFAVVFYKYETIAELTSLALNTKIFDVKKVNASIIYDVWISQAFKTNPQLKTKDVLESDLLYSLVPILCVVFTKSVNNTKYIKKTWGKRCNKLVFFGMFYNKRVPVIKLNSASSWNMLCSALLSANKMNSGDVDWIIVTDDQTFVIVENFKKLVAGLNESEPYYLGHVMQRWGLPYNLARSGYALNKIALKHWGYNLQQSKGGCSNYASFSGFEDYVLGMYEFYLTLHFL